MANTQCLHFYFCFAYILSYLQTQYIFFSSFLNWSDYIEKHMCVINGQSQQDIVRKCNNKSAKMTKTRGSIKEDLAFLAVETEFGVNTVINSFLSHFQEYCVLENSKSLCTCVGWFMGIFWINHFRMLYEIKPKNMFLQVVNLLHYR